MSQPEAANPVPVAGGELAETPFAHALLYLLRTRASGTLRVTDPRGGQSWLRLNDGIVTAVVLPWDADDMVQGLAPLCGLTTGSYAFFQEDLLQRPELEGEADPITIVGASIERYVRDDVAAELVDRYAKTRLRLQPGKRLGRLSLPASARPLLDLVRAEPANTTALTQGSPLPPEQTRRVLYALIVTHCMVPYDTAQLEAHKAAHQHRTRQSMPPHAAEVAPAGPVAARPAPATKASRSTGTFTRSLVQGAAKKRASLADNSGQSLEIAMAQAEIQFKQGKIPEARMALEKLARKYKDNASLHALRAQLMYDRDARAEPEMPAHIARLVDQALELDGDHPKALFLKALQLKQAGDGAKALRFFKRTLEVDPGNIEAKRELRIARMRAE
jgi:tetratricopeptide (TPR) repeat protein